MNNFQAYIYDVCEGAILKWNEFSKNSLLQDAIVRRLEIIGEAADRVSSVTQKKHGNLPWQAMKGTRNRVIHDYDSIQIEIIWDIVQKDLPFLVKELEKVVSSE